MSLWIIMIAGWILAGGLLRANRRWAKANTIYAELVEQQKQDYHALEIGRDEESEAYEMQFLSFQEQIQAKDNTIKLLTEEAKEMVDKIEDLDREVQHHREVCLPMVAEGF